MNYKIEYINDFGMGVTVVNSHKVFVPYTIEGETVTISDIQDHGKFFLALPISIISPSASRAEAECKYYGTCGGCKLQHMNNELYRRLKKDIVVKALKKLGQNDSIITHCFFGDFGQRRRTNFRAYLKDRRLVFGYFSARTNELVDISECLLLKPEINSLIPKLKQCVQKFDRRMLEMNSPIDISITVCDNGIDLVFKSKYSITDFEKASILNLPEEVIRINWQVDSSSTIVLKESTVPMISFYNSITPLSPGSFLQVSKESQDEIIKFILSKIIPGSKILDLFAGNGTYSIPLSKDNQIYAVEGNPNSIEALKNIRNIGTEFRDLYKKPFKKSAIDKFDYVIINPPRNGATPQITELSKSKVKSIITVYCDIQSFVRDCKIMLSKGWQLSEMAIIDQFYQSPHIEVIGIFKYL